MKNRESGKTNASLVISMIALFIAVSGVATAAKNNNTIKLPPNSVGTAQIKPGAVTSKEIGKAAVKVSDIAPNAVTSKGLAPSAVTSASLAPNSVKPAAIAPNAVAAAALAPNAVTASAIAPKAVAAAALAADSVTAAAIAPSAVTTAAIGGNAITGEKIAAGSVTGQKLSDKAVGKEKLGDGAVGEDQLEAGAVTTPKIGPKAVTALKIDSTPGAQVTAGATVMDSTFMTCFFKNEVPFTGVDWNRSGTFDAGNPAQLTAPINGTYRVTSSLVWAAGGGTVRDLYIRRIIGSGPNIGQSVGQQSVTGPPASEGPTKQSISFELELDAGDHVVVQPSTCGANVSLTSATLGLNWVAP